MAAAEHHLVFVYGTLKKGQPNHPHMDTERWGHVEYVGSGHTSKKYPLVIAGNYNIPYLLYEPGQGHHVQGEIYKVDDTQRDKLDDFERNHSNYERLEEDIVVTSGPEQTMKTFKCWVYFVKNYKPKMLQLEHMANYDSYGPHGLQYVERRVSAKSKEVTSEPLM